MKYFYQNYKKLSLYQKFFYSKILFEKIFIFIILMKIFFYEIKNSIQIFLKNFK
jgi:hypothetical protein